MSAEISFIWNDDYNIFCLFGLLVIPMLMLLNRTGISGKMPTNLSLTNEDETKIIVKNQLYRLLKSDVSYITSSPILNIFFNQSQLTYREEFFKIEEDLVSTDFISASNKAAALNPQSLIEDNYKQFYTTYIKQNVDSLNANDSLMLYTIASDCPFTAGAVVYQARVMYEAVYNTGEAFEDICNMEQSRQLTVKESKSDFKCGIFPNPTTGEINIKNANIELQEIRIRIYDVYGKISYDSNLHLDNGETKFNSGLNNGIYVVEILSEEKGVILKQKLIISK
jgi:hypothetical protein